MREGWRPLPFVGCSLTVHRSKPPKPEPGACSSQGDGAAQTVVYNNRLQAKQIKLAVGGVERQRYDYGYGNVDGATGTIDTSQNTGQAGRIEGFIDGVKQWQQRLHYDKTGRLTLASEHRGTTIN